jgi:hypothetical protein
MGPGSHPCCDGITQGSDNLNTHILRVYRYLVKNKPISMTSVTILRRLLRIRIRLKIVNRVQSSFLMKKKLTLYQFILQNNQLTFETHTQYVWPFEQAYINVLRNWDDFSKSIRFSRFLGGFRFGSGCPGPGCGFELVPSGILTVCNMNENSTSRRSQRDVVYLGWPIALSHLSPNAGEGGNGGLRGIGQWVQLSLSCAHGA